MTMLSGFSSSLMKLLLDSDPLEEDAPCTVNENREVITGVRKNPYMTLRNAINAADYNKVRKMLHDSSEGGDRKKGRILDDCIDLH